ncbi:hypothetical protein BS47DRAFT_1378618 [Hydnum rufescens UP504]|uniref:Uncharacterized protein n=1 Tax=Hydnum rufescens UP504 TaxID=1448309 RepID=A0A9P6DZQ7_9AGAM|nr:hypothetical protein BS47DRAFT_1378618 [Hydnum rufescens UP504]
MSFAAANLFSTAVAKSRDRSTSPFRIRFGEDWRNNGIMDWHNSPDRRPTKIKMFQLRRERSRPLNHQYVVLFLSDDCILRLDRRGDEAKPMDALTSEGIESFDTIANVKSLAELDKTSDTLAEFHCQKSDIHLLNIIKICVGIHRDDKAKNYTLWRFNCYFFAWTVLVATARHVVQWDMLPSDSPWETLSQNMAGALSKKSADIMIKLMIGGTVKNVMTIRRKLKSPLSRAMSRRARFLWAMPEWLIRPGLRLMFQWSGKSGIHTSLRLKLQEELLSALEPTLRSVLTDLRADTLRTTLWKDDIEGATRKAARGDVTISLLHAATAAVSSTKVTDEDVDAFRSRARTLGDPDFLGGRTADWRPAIIAGFRTLMEACPRFAAPEARALVTDDTKWDEVWNSIRDIVRDASKEAMKDAKEGLWDAFMEVWAEAWEILRPEIRDAARSSLNDLADVANDMLAACVVNNLQDTHLHINGRDMISRPSRLRHVPPSKFIAGLADGTQSECQRYTLKLIRDYSRRFNLGPGVENDMRAAMDRIWRVVVALDVGGAGTTGDPNADVS